MGVDGVEHLRGVRLSEGLSEQARGPRPLPGSQRNLQGRSGRRRSHGQQTHHTSLTSHSPYLRATLSRLHSHHCELFASAQYTTPPPERGAQPNREPAPETKRGEEHRAPPSGHRKGNKSVPTKDSREADEEDEDEEEEQASSRRGKKPKGRRRRKDSDDNSD